jgi:nucleotide-binding universal stress UspA family protein
MAASVIGAVDPAALDLAPARFAATIAGFTGAPLVFAGVYSSDEVATRLAGGQFGEDLRDGAGDVLDEVVAELRTTGAETLAVGATSVPRGLDLTAQEIGAGLIVTGSASGAADGRVTPGGVGRRLLNGAPCAVAIVPRGHDREEPPATIGVGFVDSAEGRDALRAAHVLADRSGARLRVIAAVQRRPWMHGDPDEVEADLRTRAERAAGESGLALVGEPVDVDVDVGEPADLLVRASGEVDLLVLGARAYGGRAATALGGVGGRVAGEAACPVIVLARGAEVGLDALVDGA